MSVAVCALFYILEVPKNAIVFIYDVVVFCPSSIKFFAEQPIFYFDRE